MDYKQILAAHMNNANEKDDYLTDNKMGGYVVSNLDMKEIANYKFNDKNIYVFDSCLLKNVNLHFNSNTIVFQNCIFEGNVSINDNGDEERCFITFRGNNNTFSLHNLYVRAQKVLLTNNDINCVERFTIKGDICGINACTLICPITTVESKVICVINDSTIENIQIRYNALNIKNSNLNGRNIDSIGPDNDMLLHEKGISRSKK